jgi:hypothetical protein
MMQVQLNAQKLQLDAQNDEKANAIKAANVAVADKNADTQRLQALAGIDAAEATNELAADKVQAERERTAVNVAIKTADMSHQHVKDRVELVHKLAGGNA